MKEFWEEQSLKKVEFIHSISNLSRDQDFSKEKSKIEMLVVKNNFDEIKKHFDSCIEIGAGTCQWTPLIKKYSKSVLATDTSMSMLKKGKEYLEKKYQLKGVSFFSGDILKEEFPEKSPYDLFFISGLVLYLDEKIFLDLLNFINNFSSKDSIILMREPVAINKRYILDNVFSEELQMNYSAIYRTESEIIENFKKFKFSISDKKWFHPDGSKFNKWDETRLKLFTFKRSSK